MFGKSKVISLPRSRRSHGITMEEVVVFAFELGVSA